MSAADAVAPAAASLPWTTAAAVRQVPGLFMLYEPISPAQEQQLLAAVNAGTWNYDLARRTQHFGFRYDYKTRQLPQSLGPMPEWLRGLAANLGLPETQQVIVNEYTPGQGISAHIDSTSVFGPQVASLSLGSPVIMSFYTHAVGGGDGERVDVWLPRRSLVILTGDARYRWTHAIAARQSDVVNGERQSRGTRVSLTFRTLAG